MENIEELTLFVQESFASGLEYDEVAEKVWEHYNSLRNNEDPEK